MKKELACLELFPSITMKIQFTAFVWSKNEQQNMAKLSGTTFEKRTSFENRWISLKKVVFHRPAKPHTEENRKHPHTIQISFFPYSSN